MEHTQNLNSWVHGYWWMGDNFGDMLAPYLIEKLSGKRAVWTDVHTDMTVYLVSGSTATCSRANTVLWGVGTIDSTRTVQKPMEICAVRGPLTRAQMTRCGHSCPEIYGDSALILPCLYRPKVSKRYRLGIVPHWTNLAKVWSAYGSESDVAIINVTDPVESVIDQICQCTRIASASLHGLVVSDAYGIPNIMVEFSDGVHGKNVKFADYWEGTGQKPHIPLNARNRMDIQAFVDAAEPRTIKADINALLQSCPLTKEAGAHGR